MCEKLRFSTRHALSRRARSQPTAHGYVGYSRLAPASVNHFLAVCLSFGSNLDGITTGPSLTLACWNFSVHTPNDAGVLTY